MEAYEEAERPCGVVWVNAGLEYASQRSSAEKRHRFRLYILPGLMNIGLRCEQAFQSHGTYRLHDERLPNTEARYGRLFPRLGI